MRTPGISREQLLFAAALVIAGAGAALFAAPVGRLDLDPFAAPDARAVLDGAEQEGVGEKADQLGLHKLAASFDLSGLPEAPPPVVPPPDPAAELKRFRFAGYGSSGDRHKAMFQGDGAILTLSVGGLLAGFTLERIDQDAAVFVKDGLEARLSLGAPQ